MSTPIMNSPLIDMARGVASQAVAGAQEALTVAQDKLDELAQRHRLSALMADLGQAYYDEQRGAGDHGAVLAALAAIDGQDEAYGGSDHATPDEPSDDA